MPNVETQTTAEEIAEAEQKALADAVKAEDEADAEFDAGFDQESSSTPTVDHPLPGDKKEPETPATTVPATGIEPVPALTKEQQAQVQTLVTSAIQEIKTKMEQQFGTAFGKMGGIEKTVKDMAAAASGSGMAVSEEDFEALKTEYPELTGNLVKGLSKVLSKVKTPGVAVDTTAMQRELQEKVTAAKQEVKQELARETLEDLHPGWRELVGLPKEHPEYKGDTEYRAWLATQSADEQARIANTWSPFIIGASLDKFKAAQHASKEKPAVPVGQTRKDRLAEAVSQRVSGAQTRAAAKTDDEEFDEGFRTGRS